MTLVVLQDHLLDDAVQQQPVLHRVAAPLICGEGGAEKLVTIRTADKFKSEKGSNQK